MLASFLGISLPPIVALVTTLGFIVVLFRRDFRQRPNVTRALWLPLFWLLIGCSRHVSEWLGIVGLPVKGAVSVEEGSPLDACFYFGLIVAGIYVLNKRGLNGDKLFAHNGWLVAFLVYCFIAIIWSDFPFVAFKRFIKILGQPIMALVVLTEPNFKQALTTLMKRSAYILLPLSILLIKYYPDIGRKFDQWTGLALNCGVTGGKNMLGAVCMLLGFFFCWLWLKTWRDERSKERRNELILIFGVLLMDLYLFRLAHSATSLVCAVVGVVVVFLLGRRFVNKRMVTFYLIAGVTALIVAEMTFGISTYVLDVLNKDSTLTTRTTLWADLLNVKINPIFGVGFESFWLGDRLVQFHEGRSWQPNEAHNGYLETYLNLGLVGVFMLLGVLFATFRKAKFELLRNFEWGQFRLAFVIVIVLYNITEVSFRGPHPLWFVFYIVAIDYPLSKYQSLSRVSEHFEPEEQDAVLAAHV